jgi:hypothetical protein
MSPDTQATIGYSVIILLSLAIAIIGFINMRREERLEKEQESKE